MSFDHPMQILAARQAASQARQAALTKLLANARAAYHESSGRTVRLGTVMKMRQVLRDLIEMTEAPK